MWTVEKPWKSFMWNNRFHTSISESSLLKVGWALRRGEWWMNQGSYYGDGEDGLESEEVESPGIGGWMDARVKKREESGLTVQIFWLRELVWRIADERVDQEWETLWGKKAQREVRGTLSRGWWLCRGGCPTVRQWHWLLPFKVASTGWLLGLLFDANIVKWFHWNLRLSEEREDGIYEASVILSGNDFSGISLSLCLLVKSASPSKKRRSHWFGSWSEWATTPTFHWKLSFQKAPLPSFVACFLICSSLSLSFSVISACVSTDLLVTVNPFADLASAIFRASLHTFDVMVSSLTLHALRFSGSRWPSWYLYSYKSMESEVYTMCGAEAESLKGRLQKGG